VILSIYSMVNLAQKSSAGMERRIAAQQDEKTALDLMAMEIRMASYNPLFIPDNQIWANSDCTGLSSNPVYKGIQEATANSLTIQMDINDDGRIRNPNNGEIDSNEVIRYNYDSDNLYITRATKCTGKYPFLGDTAASGKPRNVRVINNSMGIPVFRYYNGDGAEITNALATDYNSTTTGIPAIRRIEITLMVETENPDLNSGKRKKIVYSTSVIVRNHAPRI
jgi:hypothetical protein